MDIQALRERFRYSEEHKGIVYAIDHYGKKAGEPAGKKYKCGTIVIQCPDKKRRAESQVVWALHYGHFPDFKVVHRNGDPSDNRVGNLIRGSAKLGRGQLRPDASRLNELFIYREDGELIRRSARSAHAKQHAIVGTNHHSGYVHARVDGIHYAVHQIVWVLHNGDVPDGLEIDHINGQRNDNRIENLRLVTRSENLQNTRTPNHSSTGIKGVSFDKGSCKYRAHISTDGKTEFLGSFTLLEDAFSVRAEAELQLHSHRRRCGVHKK